MTKSRPFDIAAAHAESLGREQSCIARLSPDTVLTLMDTGERFEGSSEVTALFDYLHNQVFLGTTRVRSVQAAEGAAVLEAEFTGVHVQDFGGRMPTGKEVQSRYAMAYDLEDGMITAIRVYWSLGSLLRQLRGG